MSYTTEYIAGSLKTARERKEYSQRALSAKVGIPQSHISKIENGAVDLRLSSLVELSRVLDLELTLVPRKKLSAVRAIIRSDDDGHDDVQTSRRATNMLRHLIGQIEEQPTELLSEVAVQELQRRARELMHFRLSSNELGYLQEASAAMNRFLRDTRNLEAVEQAQAQLLMLRNAIVHSAGASSPSLPRPAYRLDDPDHG